MFSCRHIGSAALVTAVVMGFSMVAVDQADARRGGSMGSRGERTFQSAPATNTAPAAAPVQRSMTPSTAANRNAGPQSPGFMNGFGGSLLRGLAIGGLFGLLLGSGFGGMAGVLGFVLQVALIGGVVYLLFRLFRSRRALQPAMAGGLQGMNRQTFEEHRQADRGGLGALSGLASRARVSRPSDPNEIGVGGEDLDVFERMLTDVQAAFGREDYATLRRLTTPEMMSYLSEELGENASRGLKNEVRDVRLLQGDIAESWREGSRDYATVAMRYASIDATRERATGLVVEGDDTRATESTESWTFLRENKGSWLLSAIQES